MKKLALTYEQAQTAMARAYCDSHLMDAPPHLICPITQDFLEDPVINAAGSTYSRKAIQQHIYVTREGNCYADPLTRQPIWVNLDTRSNSVEYEGLYPNQVMKSQVQDFIDTVKVLIRGHAKVIHAHYVALKVGRSVRDTLLANALLRNDLRAVAFYTKQGGAAYSLHRSQALTATLKNEAACTIQSAWRGGRFRVNQLADAIASGDESADVLEKHTSKSKARQTLRARREAGSAVRIAILVSAASQ